VKFERLVATELSVGQLKQTALHNKRLQRIEISVSLIDNLPDTAVIARPLKRNVTPLREFLLEEI
jgi:hypothetical protein